MSPLLAKNAVHIWHVDLEETAWDAAPVLSAEERQRAANLRTQALAQRYRRARIALRLLLGRYLGQSAERLQFTYGPFGKPELADQPLHFNVSHSENQCLIALAHQPVGVDIEALGPHVDPALLMDLVCHPEERMALAGLPPAAQRDRFLKLWTRKEAYCKAVGLGLQLSLPTIRLAPALPAFRVLDGQRQAPTYYVYPLPCPAEFRASLCVPLRRPRLSRKVERPDQPYAHGQHQAIDRG